MVKEIISYQSYGHTDCFLNETLRNSWRLSEKRAVTGCLSEADAMGSTNMATYNFS